MYGGEGNINVRPAKAELDGMAELEGLEEGMTPELLLTRITPASGEPMKLGSYWYSYIPTVLGSNGKYIVGNGQTYKIFVGNTPDGPTTLIYRTYDNGHAAEAYNKAGIPGSLKRNSIRIRYRDDGLQR